MYLSEHTPPHKIRRIHIRNKTPVPNLQGMSIPLVFEISTKAIKLLLWDRQIKVIHCGFTCGILTPEHLCVELCFLGFEMDSTIFHQPYLCHGCAWSESNKEERCKDRELR